MCLISVIIPTFNSAKVISQAIQSFIDQKFAGCELIIIDGGSSDATIDILKSYMHHISYLISEPDNGLYDAMNKGIDKANGEWLYFLGSDDQILNSVFDNLSHHLKQDFKLVYGNVIYDNGHQMYSQFNNRMILENTLHHQSAFYHHSLFSSFRYDSSLKVVADYELNLRAYLNKVHSLKVNRTIAKCGSSGVSSLLVSDETNTVRSRYIKNPIVRKVLNAILDGYYSYFRLKKSIVAKAK